MPYTEYDILLADDDADDCFIFQEVLTELGIKRKPVVINDGVATINYLKGAILLPDIIFLDINMPLKDGLTVLKELREEPTLVNIPVVMFSTTRHTSAVQNAYDLGASLYACKPGGFTKYIPLLGKILSLDVGGLLTRRSIDRFVVE
jgi:CheY-like chemotaxis protein